MLCLKKYSLKNDEIRALIEVDTNGYVQLLDILEDFILCESAIFEIKQGIDNYRNFCSNHVETLTLVKSLWNALEQDDQYEYFTNAVKGNLSLINMETEDNVLLN